MIQMNKKFIPVMLMPFHEDETIDYGALGALVDLYLAAGAGGLFANCLSSEMFELSREEMLESVSFIVKRVNGRVPVVATGTFEDAVEKQAEFVIEMYGTGVDSVIIITGLLAKEEESDEVFHANVERLLALTGDVPLGFYECPVPYKRVLSAEFLGKLAATGRIKYHKDTSLDISSIHAKIAATREVEGFGLYDAYMVHAVESLKAGSAGLSCIQGNYFPKMIAWLCEHYDDRSQKDRVDKIQQFLIDNMDVMHYAYPASSKYYLKLSGFDIGTTCRRKDIEELDVDVRRRLKELFANYEQLQLGVDLQI